MKNDHRNKFSNLSNWKEEAWKKKNQGFNGIWTRDLHDTGAMLYIYIYIYIYLVDKVPQDITSTVPNIYAHMHKLDKKDN